MDEYYREIERIKSEIKAWEESDLVKDERNIAVNQEVRRAYFERGVPYRRCIGVLDKMADRASFYTRHTRQMLQEEQRARMKYWLLLLLVILSGALVAYAYIHLVSLLLR